MVGLLAAASLLAGAGGAGGPARRFGPGAVFFGEGVRRDRRRPRPDPSPIPRVGRWGDLVVSAVPGVWVAFVRALTQHSADAWSLRRDAATWEDDEPA